MDVGVVRRGAIVAIATISLFLAGFVGASAGGRWTAEQALALDAHTVTIAQTATAHNLVLSVEALRSQRNVGLVSDARWDELMRATRSGLTAPIPGRLAPTAAAAVRDYQVSASAFLDRLATDVLEEDHVGAAETQAAFSSAIDLLESGADDLRMAIDAQGMDAHAQHTALGVLVGLVLPLAAVLGYRWVAGRRVASVREEAEVGRQVDREDLLAGLAHELRTPLTGITGFAGILGHSELDPDEAAEVARLIGHESAELGRRVDDLMTTARLKFNARTLVTEEIDVAELVDSLMPLLEAKDVERAIDAGLTMCTDASLVHQALRNLVVNARDHGGGRVAISATRRVDGIEVVIEDDGAASLDASAIERLAQPFHHGRRALVTGSVGMGLSTVHAIARHLGGELRLESRDGWTRFVLALPQRRASEKADTLAIGA